MHTEQRQTQDLSDKLMESVTFMKELQQEKEKLQGTMAKLAGKLREARAEILVVRKDHAEVKQKKKLKREQRKAAMRHVHNPLAGWFPTK